MNPEAEKAYSSAHERDYLLDYKSVDVDSLERVDILGVPVDNVSRDEAVAVILDCVEKKKGPYHVFFVDPVKLMRVRPGKSTGFVSAQARLILPDGAGIQWAAEKLGRPLKERIAMISLIIDLMRAAWKKNLTVYLLGSKMENVEKITLNWQRIFPGIRIIGRQGGYFNDERERLIKESMRKSSPDIVLLGMGFPRQEKWIQDNWQHLSNAVVIGVDGSFGILSGKERKAPDFFQVRGLLWFWRTIARPWMVGRWLNMTGYFIYAFFRSIGSKEN